MTRENWEAVVVLQYWYMGAGSAPAAGGATRAGLARDGLPIRQPPTEQLQGVLCNTCSRCGLLCWNLGTWLRTGAALTVIID